MNYNIVYKTQGTCSREIRVCVEDNVIKGAEFDGGCPGNLAGISELICGMSVDEVIERLGGIRCGNKATSCPDQLARALVRYKIEAEEPSVCLV